ncbi:MAG: FAD-dependent oxidoreductase [Myxococcota bacterium]|nr:FAD-dependent oxidoreductase [Myxococcota bacterium]
MTGARIDRRSFGLGAAGAWLLGCDDTEQTPRVRAPTTQRVAVVGGGVAGLYCAGWLFGASVEVQLYEALPRLGGRVFTARNAFQPALLCELGAEFLGAYDAAMHTLAGDAGVQLSPVTIPEGFTARRFWLGGAEVSQQQLEQGLSVLLPKAEAAMATKTARATLDNTTLAEWLAANTGDDASLLHALTAAYRTEFGVEPSELSAMHLSALLGRASGVPFHFFPLRGATLRCETTANPDNSGMDRLTARIADALVDNLHFECRLRRITRNSGRFTLSFEQSNGLGFETEAEHVVLAIPFSALRDVDFSGLNLERSKRQWIAELGYGNAVKLAATFNGKPWRFERSTGDVLDDTRRLWESGGGSGTIGLLAAVLGGDAGLAALSGSADDQFAPILAELKQLFQTVNVEDAYRAGSAVRVAWPTQPFARGSASCLRPGQWARQAEIARRDGDLHFCGEHCSLDFQGRLEGAAESGALAAAEILEDLKRPMLEPHAKLVAMKRKVWQPYGSAGDAPELSPIERAERVLEQHAEYIAGLEA